MNKIKVSIIVPVYNVEDYIEECIDSIVNQTLKEIEIIIVNDGTKDNSIKKIEKYLSDPRVVLINKENGGLSSARNAGLKLAKGEYISFIDSDDFIELTMLEDLYNNSEDSEIVFSDIILYNNITKEKKDRKRNIIQKKIGRGSSFLDGTPLEVWNKIYKKEYLEKINLKFIEGIIYEDVNFTIESMFLAKKVKYIEKGHYYYRINRNSSIIAESNKNRNSFLVVTSDKKIVEEIKEFYRKNEKKISSYEKILLKLYELEWQIKSLKDQNRGFISKKEIEIFENILYTEWNYLNIREKEILKEKMKKIFTRETKIIFHIDILNSFYYRNKIFTLKILRRILKRKILNRFCDYKI